jgi:hypothetical protein
MQHSAVPERQLSGMENAASDGWNEGAKPLSDRKHVRQRPPQQSSLAPDSLIQDNTVIQQTDGKRLIANSNTPDCRRRHKRDPLTKLGQARTGVRPRLPGVISVLPLPSVVENASSALAPFQLKPEPDQLLVAKVFG